MANIYISPLLRDVACTNSALQFDLNIGRIHGMIRSYDSYVRTKRTISPYFAITLTLNRDWPVNPGSFPDLYSLIEHGAFRQ